MSSMYRVRRFLPPFHFIICLAFLVGIVEWGGIALAQTADHVAPIWLGNGLILGVLLCISRSFWPVLLLVGLSANLAVRHATGDDLSAALPLALINSLEILSAAWSLERLLGKWPDLEQPRSFGRFLAIGAFLVPALSMLLAAATLYFLHGTPFFTMFPERFWAHAAGTCIMTPLVLSVLRGDFAAIFSRSTFLRSLSLLFGFTALATGVFLQTRYPLLFLIPPVFMAAAVYLGFAGVVLCAPILTGIALIATAADYGPFSLNLNIQMSERFIMAQMFIVISFLIAHRISFLVVDRRRIATALQAERDSLTASELSLIRSEAGFRLLAENSSDVISRVGPDGNRLYMSPASKQVFGVTPNSLINGSVLKLIHPADIENVVMWQSRLLAGTVEDTTMIFRVLNPTRGEVWVEGRARSLLKPESGKPDGYVSVLRDISERQVQADELRAANAKLEQLARQLSKARDQAERASQAKSRFLTAMSHELRTPLNGVIGYAELLRLEGGLNAKQAGRVDAMLGAGTHLLQMINRVLDLSEVESEHTELQMSVVALQHLAHSCLDLVRPAAEAKGLALDMTVAGGVPLQITTDATRLRQVLLNLLGNAVKFTASGTVELAIRVAGATLLFEVVDTGPGILAEHRWRLFKEFERFGADPDAAEGAGVGLALSGKLAALLGGKVEYDDNPSGGSVFRLELPLPTTASTAVAPQSMGGPSGKLQQSLGPAETFRVLLVDDVEMNRDIAASFLHTAGHDVVCADGGAAAVHAAQSADFDVVLMDVRMPDVDGLEATRRIRLLTGSRGRVPIVGLTAQAFADEIEKCRAAGMNDHLSKPFAPNALLAIVVRAVGLARSSAATDSISVPSSAAVVEAAGGQTAIFDVLAFDRVAIFFRPDLVMTHLRSIEGSSEALLTGLRAPGALVTKARNLAGQAHTLSGSAGLFGFKRLAEVAGAFEHAVQIGSPAASALAGSLAEAIELSLVQIRTRLRNGDEAECAETDAGSAYAEVASA